jgi:hypothetical protein
VGFFPLLSEALFGKDGMPAVKSTLSIANLRGRNLNYADVLLNVLGRPMQKFNHG